jgi:hypothetical protein
MGRTHALLLGLFLSFPAAALAQTAPSVSDNARCVVAMVAYSSVAGDPKRTELGHLGVAYYAGRVKSEAPNYDLARQLRALAASMDQKALQAEIGRCGPPLLKVVQDIGAAFPKPPAPPPHDLR